MIHLVPVAMMRRSFSRCSPFVASDDVPFAGRFNTVCTSFQAPKKLSVAVEYQVSQT